MQLSGELVAPRTPAEVADLLGDPAQFALLFPDFRGVEVEDLTHFTVALAAGFGSLNGTLKLRLERMEFEPARRLRYSGGGIAAGNQILFELAFDLEPIEGGSRTLWNGSFSVQGALALFAAALIDDLGRHNLEQLVANLGNALSGPPPIPHISV